MCKEMPVIPADRGVDKKRGIGKKWRKRIGTRGRFSATEKCEKSIGC
jgi:hypothetical protein